MKVEKITIKRAFIICVTALSFLILLGAFATPILAYYKIDLSHGLYALYSKLCVESSSKAFLISGYNIPLCARCLGIYGGIFLTLVLYLEQIKIPKNLYYVFGILGIGEIVLDYFNLIFPDNWVTLSAGILTGIFCIITLLRLEIKYKKDY